MAPIPTEFARQSKQLKILIGLKGFMKAPFDPSRSRRLQNTFEEEVGLDRKCSPCQFFPRALRGFARITF